MARVLVDEAELRDLRKLKADVEAGRVPPAEEPTTDCLYCDQIEELLDDLERGVFTFEEVRERLSPVVP